MAFNRKDALPVLNDIVLHIEIERAKQAGKPVPYGFVSSIVKQKKPMFPWLTMDRIYNHLKKLNKKPLLTSNSQLLPPSSLINSTCSTSAAPPPSSQVDSSSALSTLTASTSVAGRPAPDQEDSLQEGYHETSGDIFNSPLLRTNSNGGDVSSAVVNASITRSTYASLSPTSHLDSTMSTLTPSSIVLTSTSTGIVDSSAVNVTSPKTASGGRPKGTTSTAKLATTNQVAMAMKQATEQYSAAKQRALEAPGCSRVARGTLSRIIADCKENNGVPADIIINTSTIRSRVLRENFSLQTHPGTVSPLAEIEPYIVSMIIQFARMRTPLTPKEALELVNSIVSTPSTLPVINAWRKKHCTNYRLNESVPLTAGYWSGFMRRNGHWVMKKGGVKFDCNRDDWCKYTNFLHMFEQIYTLLVEKGIAIKLDTAVWLNKQGEIVEHEADAFGMKTKYLLKKPGKLIFVDEVGSNTSQAKDGHVGGQKFLCQKNGRPQIRAATKDAHFTVLGFTAATGEAVMCAIIFAAKELDPAWVIGLDPFAVWMGDEDNVIGNSGPGKKFPHGPVCHINGKDVPTLCCASESGSITSELLAEMLRAMDDIGIFDRSDGVDPCLLLDGHGSRFQLPFLDYILNENHRWTVTIGVPYGTSLWQVGDSTEQNGCFKMALAREKKALVSKKAANRVCFAIEKTDVVYLVGKAWQSSFGRTATNSKAIAERGWGPLNYNVLLHDELQETKPRMGLVTSNLSNQNTGAAAVETLNLTSGYAGTLVDQLVLHRNRLDATAGVNIDNQARLRAEKAQEQIASGKQYTAGLHFQAGNVAIAADVHVIQQERKRKADEKESDGREKKRQAYNSALLKVTAIRNSNKTPEQWSVAQLKTMVAWFKQGDKGAIPTKKTELLARYYATLYKGEPTPPPPMEVQPTMPLVIQEPVPVVPPNSGDVVDDGSSSNSGEVVDDGSSSN